jgi:hypothetical protein
MKHTAAAVALLAVSAISVFSVRAHAQQEVDPDHFEQSSAKITNSNVHKAAPIRHHSQGNARIASKHGGNKAHRRSWRVSS